MFEFRFATEPSRLINGQTPDATITSSTLSLSFLSGALPLVTATTLCFPPVLKWLIIVSYCLLSLWGLYKVSLSRGKYPDH